MTVDETDIVIEVIKESQARYIHMFHGDQITALAIMKRERKVAILEENLRKADGQDMA